VRTPNDIKTKGTPQEYGSMPIANNPALSTPIKNNMIEMIFMILLFTYSPVVAAYLHFP
jgi:hypothetical protein